MDITSVPLSFQVGVNDNVELFFTTEGYRGVKVNSPRNLSGFYLPNARVLIDGVRTTAPAITLGVGSLANRSVFRPTGTCGVASYPFPTSGSCYGTPVTGGSAGLFPGLGSAFGGILPGVVLQTALIETDPEGTGGGTVELPTIFTLAPSYLGDAPFISRSWATSSFNSMDFGVK